MPKGSSIIKSWKRGDNMKRKYAYRKRLYSTSIPKEVAEVLKLDQEGEIQWSISKKGVVTVKKVEEGK